MLRSHAAQTAIDRYRRADSLIEGIQPTFTPISATLPTGSAPSDLSAGWDGTLWAIDEQGAPHIYDPINDEWNVHGEGIDAAAAIGNTLYLFRGNQYVTVTVTGDGSGSTQQTSAPLPITTIVADPQNNPLPRSFQLGISGAASWGNTLYLFHGGWYLPVNNPQAKAKVTDIPGWPTTSNWADGVIDALYNDTWTATTVWHGEEYIVIRPSASGTLEVVSGPMQGLRVVDAGARTQDGSIFYYSGVQVRVAANQPRSGYIPTMHQNWPATWNPVLTHAPSGRMGNLWVATKDGDFVHHNGENWSLALPDAQATSVSVGNDNSVWMAHHSTTANFPDLYTGINIPGISFAVDQASARSFAFDYDGSGKQDHLVFYSTGNGTTGTGKIAIAKNNGDHTFTQMYPAPGTPASEIGRYSFDEPGNPLSGQPGNLGFAFDYDGTGNLDHLVFYRPGTGAISILKNQGGTFTQVYPQSGEGPGIGGYDLSNPADLGFAFDYDGTGNLDHLVFYRPGTGAISIIKKNKDGSFTPVYQTHTGGIGGYDLLGPQDRGFAFDYDGTGKLDHLVFYRPGTGAIFILKNNSGSFTTVYQQGDPGRGIGDFDLMGQYDQGFAFDYKGTGKQNYLVFYSPGTGKISILQNFNGNFLNVYPQGQQTGGIGNYDLLGPTDLGFSFDATGSRTQNGLVFYRPGHGEIFVLETQLDYTPILGGWANGSFTEHPQPPKFISQVAVGDASRVWVRDGQNNVMQYDGQSQQYNPNAQVGQAAHIGANNDGTLWHCNNTPDAHRLVSEASASSQSLSVNTAVTSVQRVATTGFGSSHCLTQHSDGTQGIYRYDSPYVFKTSKAYPETQQIVSGLGRIYVVQSDGDSNVFIYALDMHTGEELASCPISTTFDNAQYDNIPVLDPINELVYFFNNADSTTGNATLLALDAYTLETRWSFSLVEQINFAGKMPALEGTCLCVYDTAGDVILFDTRAALAAAPNPKPKKIFNPSLNLPNPPATTNIPPVISNGRICMVFTPGVQNVYIDVFDTQGNLKVSQGPFAASSFDTSYGSIATNSASTDEEFTVYTSFVNGVMAFTPYVNGAAAVNSQLLSGGTIATDITYDDGSRLGSNSSSHTPCLWFGDSVGNLWCLDATTLQPLPNYPRQVIDNEKFPMWSTPVIYKDTSGGATVFFGLGTGGVSQNLAETYNLFGYDPDSGNFLSVPTGATCIASLSQITNGVLYAAGGNNSSLSTSSPTNADPNSIAQVFGIRVDMLVQTTHDFIIESQMMQDPDESADNGNIDHNNPPPNPIPPSVNRYQTHLTVVDNNKAPRAKESLKIWADKPNTQITLGGFSGTPNGPNGSFNSKTNTYTCTIGPDDGDFVSVNAGVDGAITIVSNANDMYATPLRVWASFMNSYERIVVNPDQEFHQRVTTAHSDKDNNDPTQVNLVTTTNYKGTPLFSSAEVSAGQPAQTATAVGQMKQGLNLGGTNTSTRLSYSRLMQGSRLVPHSPEGVQLAATSQAYTAYTDLHGMGYFATNVPSQRPVTPVQSVGFIFTSGFTTANKPAGPNAPSTNASIQTCTHSDALAEVDTWTGSPWQPSGGVGERTLQGRRRLGSGLGNWWTDFWNWLSNAVETVLAFVQKVVVAIGDAVMVGINLIVDGIEQVFHCKIQFLEDIAAAIGSFFNMLEKVLSDVLEALSILFQFGEIINTQKWIKQFLIDQLVSLESTISQNVITPVKNQFTSIEKDIATFFNNAADNAPSGPLNQQPAIAQQPQLQGDGATSHTAYTVGQSGSSSSSHAVQCDWGTQKMKAGLPVSTMNSASMLNVGDDPISDFVSGLIQAIGTEVSQNFSDLQSRFSANFSSSSSFFQTVIKDFLELVKDLVETLVGIAKTIAVGNEDDNPTGTFPGLLNSIGSIINYLIGSDGKGGILNFTIEIPVLSWLFTTVTNGEDLTLLNLITLVAAIPATIIFRAIEGEYPSKAGFNVSPTTAVGTLSYTDSPQEWSLGVRTIIGAVGIVVSGLCGFFCAVGDADPDADAMPLFVYAYSFLTLLSIGLALPYSTESNPGETDWVLFGLNVTTYLLSAGMALGTMTSDPEDPDKPQVVSGMMCFYSIMMLIIVAALTGGGASKDAWAGVAFAAAILSYVPSVMNPLKWTTLRPVVVVLDVAIPITAAVLTFVDWTKGTTSTQES